jgi:hypothetical protein
MAENKIKSKPTAAAPTPVRASSLGDTMWKTTLEVLDDARGEVHKQTAGLIGWFEGALLGATRFAAGLNDRVDHVVREGLQATDRTGRRLLESSRGAARTAAHRATSTARSLVASPPEENRAAS